ncbi:MAG: hypothetical protein ACLR71_20990 [[Clostridium] scindens]
MDGTTLDMYLANMRNMLMEQLAESELIVVNRCPDGVDRSGFRRALKVQNPMARTLSLREWMERLSSHRRRICLMM